MALTFLTNTCPKAMGSSWDDVNSSHNILHKGKWEELNSHGGGGGGGEEGPRNQGKSLINMRETQATGFMLGLALTSKDLLTC